MNAIEEAGVGYAFDKLRVMVAEDNEHVMQLLQITLRAFGIRHLTLAEDGAEAFGQFKARDIDVIITDFEMQPAGGIELLDLVRLSPESPDSRVPVVMITGHTAIEQVEMARDHGVTEILAKPFTPKGLSERLTLLIEHPRPFIRSPDFFGPDRRRGVDPAYKGPDRRQKQPQEVHNGA